jgi:hypothetical protein
MAVEPVPSVVNPVAGGFRPASKLPFVIDPKLVPAVAKTRIAATDNTIRFFIVSPLSET